MGQNFCLGVLLFLKSFVNCVTMKIMNKVLLIEDDEQVVELYNEVLEENGFHVMIARNGKEGIIEAARWVPDLILLDIRMPEMDGIVTLKHLKKLPETQKIPVVFLSLLSEELHEAEDLKLATAYFKKTELGPRELVEMVREVLEHQHHLTVGSDT